MLLNPDILGIIPARMASMRFPGKPLVDIKGIPMIIRVYQVASQVLGNILIATGDEEIAETAKSYGANVILTREDHISGTSRCIEAMKSWSAKTGRVFKAMLNIQGDEPMLSAGAVKLLADDILKSENRISTLVRHETDKLAFSNPNRVKVVMNNQGYALYFSRSPIPYYRTEGTSWYSHVGMYAFKNDVIDEIAKLEKGRLEAAESLEQLRWLENGYGIHCCETDYSGFGVDTPEDLDDLLQSGLV